MNEVESDHTPRNARCDNNMVCLILNSLLAWLWELTG